MNFPKKVKNAFWITWNLNWKNNQIQINQSSQPQQQSQSNQINQHQLQYPFSPSPPQDEFDQINQFGENEFDDDYEDDEEYDDDDDYDGNTEENELLQEVLDRLDQLKKDGEQRNQMLKTMIENNKK